MTSAIQELPESKDFGLGFNYSAWTANTVVSLHKVSWNSDYRDIVKFDAQSDLDNYLNNGAGPVTTVNGVSYAKFGRPVRLNIPFNTAQHFNYLRATNPAQPIPGDTARSFYYFIVDVAYINPNTTEFLIQLDIWQSFGFGITFGNCYVERGHLGVAALDCFEDHGREYLTIPEGLDIGSEYQIVDQWQKTLGTARGTDDYSILVMSTVALDADPGTVESPNLTSARGTAMENLPGGAELYVFHEVSEFKQFMTAYSDKPWVTQGIISITAIPNFIPYSLQIDYDIVDLDGAEAWKITGGSLQGGEVLMKSFFRNVIFEKLGPRYAHLHKFATAPYSMLELTTYAGTPIVIKPENWVSEHATVIELPHFVPPGARMMFYPYRYNVAKDAPAAQRDSYGVWNDGGEFLDMATGIFNFPTFSLVNNGFMGFLASNKNSLAYQHQSADWSQQKAQAGINTSYDQASANIGLSQDLNRQQIGAATQSTNLGNQMSGLRAGQSAINSLGSLGAGPMGAIGAASGIANAAIGAGLDVYQATSQLNINTGLANSTNKSTTDNAGYMRDTNKSLAEFASNGDYSNAIAGINARVQDAKLTQPTTSGQIGGDSFNLAQYKWGYDLKLKMLAPSALRAIGDFWLRYGYNVNKYRKINDLHLMNRFTFWKLKETYIVSSECPESFKQSIRGIFEKGVTVWRDPTEIGNVDIADNLPTTTESM